MKQAKLFLGRQPILDHDQKIFGYELLFRSADTLHAEISDPEAAAATVIVDTLTGFGLERVVGRHRAFLNVTADILMSESIELLPPGEVVLEILETAQVSESLIRRCRELREKGFMLALDDHEYDPVYEPLYPFVHIVKVDVLGKEMAELEAAVRKLRSWPLTLVAEKVETAEQFSICGSLGFDLFQGYYFARPSVIRQPSLDTPTLAMIRLLDQMEADAETAELEKTFRSSPPLVYHLLTLVNSVSYALRVRVRSVQHAISLIGRHHLKRWIVLALFASKNAAGMESPLLETAAVRAKTMEGLAADLGSTADAAESAFLTGVLSLLDALLGVPMEEVLPHLNVDSDVRQALLEREGRLGELLALVESLEKGDFRRAGEIVAAEGIAPPRLLALQQEAVEWVNHITGTGDRGPGGGTT